MIDKLHQSIPQDTHWEIHGWRYSLRDTWSKILIERYVDEDTHWDIHGRRYSLRDTWMKILIERYMAEDSHWEIHGPRYSLRDTEPSDTHWDIHGWRYSLRDTRPPDHSASHFYRPQTKLRKGNVFTSVCQEFCPQGRPRRPLQRTVRILILVVDGLNGGSTSQVWVNSRYWLHCNRFFLNLKVSMTTIKNLR